MAVKSSLIRMTECGLIFVMLALASSLEEKFSFCNASFSSITVNIVTTFTLEDVFFPVLQFFFKFIDNYTTYKKRKEQYTIYTTYTTHNPILHLHTEWKKRKKDYLQRIE